MNTTATRKGVGPGGEGTLQTAPKFAEFVDTKRGLEMITQDGAAVDGKIIHRSMLDAAVAKLAEYGGAPFNDGDQSGEMA